MEDSQYNIKKNRSTPLKHPLYGISFENNHNSFSSIKYKRDEVKSQSHH